MLRANGIVQFISPPTKINEQKEYFEITILNNESGYRPKIYNFQVWSDNEAYNQFVVLAEGQEVEVLCNVGCERKRDGTLSGFVKYFPVSVNTL